MGRDLSPRYDHVILVSTYAVNWPQHGRAISGRKLLLKSVRFHIGCPVVQTDGWTGGQTHVRSPDYQNFSHERLPNVLNYGALLEHGAPLLVMLVFYHLHKIKLAPTIKCLIDQSADKRESALGPAIRPFNVIQVSRCPILNTDNRPLGRSKSFTWHPPPYWRKRDARGQVKQRARTIFNWQFSFVGRPAW